MRLFADLIDALEHAEGPPPDRLWPFMAWALRGAFPAVALAVSLVVGSSEVVAAALVGWLIDLARSRGPEGLFADSWPWLLAADVAIARRRPSCDKMHGSEADRLQPVAGSPPS